MLHDSVAEDPRPKKGRRPRLIRLFVDRRILGVLLTPGGKTDSPVCVMCHGFPGHDVNLDIAHALVRSGIASVIFHYRGSWGSGGDFSFGGMVQDVGAVVSHIREKSAKMHIDIDRMALLGYSMGGWASMLRASVDPGLQNLIFIAGFNIGFIGKMLSHSFISREIVLRVLRESMPPLRGCTPKGLIDEVSAHVHGYDLIEHSQDIADRSVLMICGTRDRTSVPIVHHDPFHNALLHAGIEDLTEVRLRADHSFLGKRIALQRAIVDWLGPRLLQDSQKT